MRHPYQLPETFDRWSVIEHTHVDGAAILPDERVCDSCNLVAYLPTMHPHIVGGKRLYYCADCDDDWRERVRDAFKPPSQTAGTGAQSGELPEGALPDRDGGSQAQSGEPLQGPP